MKLLPEGLADGTAVLKKSLIVYDRDLFVCSSVCHHLALSTEGSRSGQIRAVHLSHRQWLASLQIRLILSLPQLPETHLELILCRLQTGVAVEAGCHRVLVMLVCKAAKKHDKLYSEGLEQWVVRSPWV